MKVFIEKADKRAFAGAIDWPGLARSGKTEEEALARLLEYVPRYQRSVGKVASSLTVPLATTDLSISARLEGGSGTDFGVPSTVANFDRVKLDGSVLKTQLERLKAAWQAFEKSAARAEGKILASGPRGGGRSLVKIREHVLEADRAYIAQLGAKAPPAGADWHDVQRAFIEALHAKLRGELPEKGRRGGERWPALYAIRRSAWHALDHAWEIEGRIG